MDGGASTKRGLALGRRVTRGSSEGRAEAGGWWESPSMKGAGLRQVRRECEWNLRKRRGHGRAAKDHKTHKELTANVRQAESMQSDVGRDRRIPPFAESGGVRRPGPTTPHRTVRRTTSKNRPDCIDPAEGRETGSQRAISPRYSLLTARYAICRYSTRPISRATGIGRRRRMELCQCADWPFAAAQRPARKS